MAFVQTAVLTYRKSNGEFQSDKYKATPRGKVPLSVKDRTAQDLLWGYAQRRRVVDAEFSTDLEEALRIAGYAGPSRWKRILLALLASAVAAALVGGCYDQKPTAEREARAYILGLHPHAEFTVQCMNLDTDNNGYVSCDAIIDGQQTALECAASNGCFIQCNEGCKLRPMIQVQQTQPPR